MYHRGGSSAEEWRWPADTLAAFEIGLVDRLAAFGARFGSYLATVSRRTPVSRSIRL